MIDNAMATDNLATQGEPGLNSHVSDLILSEYSGISTDGLRLII